MVCRIGMAASLLLVLHANQIFAGNLQTMHNNNSDRFVFLDSRKTRQINYFETSALYNYFNSPIEYNQGEDGYGAFIRDLHSVNLSMELSTSNKYSFGVEVPVHEFKTYQRNNVFSLGDLRFFLKKDADFWEGLKPQLSMSFSLPTGNKDYYLSNENGGLGALVSILKSQWSGEAVLNMGFDFFPNAKIQSSNLSLQSLLGAGYHRSLSEKWSWNAEWLIRQTPSSRTGDFYLGIEKQGPSDQNFFSGFSFANEKVLSSDFVYRVIAGARWKSTVNKTLIKYIHDCGAQQQSLLIPARPWNENELASVPLPYLEHSSAKGSKNEIKTIRLGQATNIAGWGIPYVRNAQVPLAFDLKEKLPPFDAIENIQEANLLMDVTKVSKDRYTSTELLCFNEQKICSGEVFTDKNWLDLINPAFFGEKTNHAYNQFFSNQYLQRPVGNLEQETIYQSDLSLPVNELLTGSTFSAQSLILSQVSPDHKGTLYLTVADDTLVSSRTFLHVHLVVNTCKLKSLEPTKTL